ncbi:hypothetical protein OU995_25410 [Roseateles sp. SL47]|uniref:hypothetical protein n=1 Tax=Roseateles sp. SL47 TaxID=2995138 RepID=UPI00227192F0|nr:hypothetical protein [Roseateles sp. SL47]WAC72818.1 hypothetical protein OU995_25410 [Roseateles sp. SL47]
MAFVRTTGGLLQLQSHKLTNADLRQAADFARDVLKKPELSNRILAAQRKQGATPSTQSSYQASHNVRPLSGRVDHQAPVLDDLDAFSPELFRAA